MNALVRFKDICDVDFSPGKKLFPVEIEDVRIFAPHEIERMQIGIKSGLLLNRRLLLGLSAGAAIALLLSPKAVFAANRTAWTAGNGVGYTWSTAIASGDMNTLGVTGMPTGNTVLSSIADIANQTNQDMFMDISTRLIIASSTIVAGANLALWTYYLLDNGTTYGDGQFPTPGTFAAKTPTFAPYATIPLVAAAAQTLLVGAATQISISPGSFRNAIQNNSGFTLTTGSQIVMYRTYNINLNN